MLHRLNRLREQTLYLYTRVPEADAGRSAHPFWSPLRWHLGHVARIESLWIRRLLKKALLDPDYDLLFDPERTPREEREARMPAGEAIRDYARRVREETEAYLEAARFPEGEPLGRPEDLVEYLCEHESQHQELMTIVLQFYSPVVRMPLDVSPMPVAIRPARARIRIPGGPFVQGAKGSSFSYDNEKPAHEVDVAAFEIDSLPVRNRDFLEFVEAGGYRKESLWTSEAFAWLREEGIESPPHWIGNSKGWMERTLSADGPLRPEHPVTGLSWYEADAFARFAGARLPTEAEWEKATRSGRGRYPWGEADPGPHLANFALHYGGTTPAGAFPAGASAQGALDLGGNVWEWTATPFQGYPGFRIDPDPEYSAPYFDGGHYVLRGGSWATQGSQLRGTFRNWYPPYLRHIHSGFRLAR